MAEMRCAVFDEALDAPCTTRASMVRTVIPDGEFSTYVYFCKEHGDAHGAVVIAVARRGRGLRARALDAKDEHLVHGCHRALLGDEFAFDECVEAMAMSARE